MSKKTQELAETATASTPVTRDYLLQNELSERLGVSESTLEKWRWKKTGPKFYKLGGVRYKISDVEAYEAEQYKKSVSE